jgi:chaperonin GroES
MGDTNGGTDVSIAAFEIVDNTPARDPNDTSLPYPVLPLEDRVMIRRDEAATMVGSIHIPGAFKEIPMQGTVVAAGPGRTENGVVKPMKVSVGMRVLISRYAGNEMAFPPPNDGDTYTIVREDEILLILRPNG